MIDPLVQEGKITRLTANLEGALSGVAVPTYMRDAGVESMSDLNGYADRFESKIYGIESPQYVEHRRQGSDQGKSP